jgi:hypothetical protein
MRRHHQKYHVIDDFFIGKPLSQFALRMTEFAEEIAAVGGAFL